MTLTFFVIVLCTCLLMGTLASRLAKQKSRDPVVWFWMGFMFGLIALMVLYLSKDGKETEEISKVEQEQPLISEESSWSGVFYTLDPKHVPLGPFTFKDIAEKFNEGALTVSSYLWHEEWPDWKLISDVPELTKALSKS